MKTLRAWDIELTFDPDGKWFGVIRKWEVKATILEGYFLRAFPLRSLECTTGELVDECSKVLNRCYVDLCRPMVMLTITEIADPTNVYVITRDEGNTQWLLTGPHARPMEKTP